MKKLAIACLTVLAVVLLLGASAIKTQSTYTDQFNPLGIPFPGIPQVGSIVNPGTISCPGHMPTGDPVQPCPAGSRIVARGVIINYPIISSDPLMRGTVTVELNANLDANYAGSVWGKVSLAPPDVTPKPWEGVWEGMWNGQRVYDPDGVWLVLLSEEFHGQGGDVAGYKTKCTELITAYAPLPVLFQGQGSCQTTVPGGKLNQ